MSSVQSYNMRNTLIIYTSVGILFGLCFPIGAILLESFITGIPLSISALTIYHKNNPLMYMIDTAPIFLGVFALIGGVSRAKAGKANAETEALFKDIQGSNAENERLLEQFEKELKINQVLQSNMAHVSQSLVKSSTDLNKTMEQMIHFGGHVDDQVRGINASVEESNGISESMVKRFSDFNNDTETMYGQMASTQEMVFLNIELSAKVEKNVNLLYVSLSELVEEAKEISKTTATIDHISENIKLLALNATIEASRAGESGKGFAVVASEVQKLSVQSELATARVAKGIQRISKDITVMTEGMSLLSEDGQRLNQSSLTMKQLCSDLDLLINSIKNQTNTITIQIKDEDFAINNIGKMTELLAADSLNLSRYINESKKAITETEGLVMTLEQHMNKQEVVVL